MSALSNLGNRIKAVYDRVIAFAMVLVLLGSLAYLAVQVGSMNTQLRKFENEIQTMTPRHPRAAVVDLEPYADAQAQLRDPFQMALDTNRYLLVPEKRVWCQGCTRPTPYAEARCVFCNATNTLAAVTSAPVDIDNDGMPTAWELANGFNPNDPEDAAQDADGDRFSNLQEYNAETDPRDATSYPNLLYMLRLVQIDKTPFKMVFVARNQMPDQAFRFQVNYGGRSYFCKLDEPVTASPVMVKDPDTGKLVSKRPTLFTVTAFREKYEERVNESINQVQQVDVSEIDLLTPGASKPTTLTFKETTVKFQAVLSLPIDNRSWTLATGEVFDLRGRKFQLIDMDVDVEDVKIKSMDDGREYRVTGETVSPIKPSAVE